jgi:NADPH:quinone reductase
MEVHMSQMQSTMHAAAIDEFGGPITPHTLPVPKAGPDELLIQIEAAGVGVWDAFEREGGFAKMLGTHSKFPYILGSEGAGTVKEVGSKVHGFKEGDQVYAMALANPKGGFYAEYVVVPANQAAPIPSGLKMDQAGAMVVDAVTALVGLDEGLGLKPGESIMIFGASGGIGHLAVQLAKRMGARVMAVASGRDGVAPVQKLGADEVVDGHQDDIVATARRFAPAGLDCILLTAGGREAESALATLRDGGRVAYPNGVEPAPKARDGIKIHSYNGTPGEGTLAMLNELIEQSPFHVHVAQTFPLEQAVAAHQALEGHFLGKLALVPAA